MPKTFSRAYSMQLGGFSSMVNIEHCKPAIVSSGSGRVWRVGVMIRIPQLPCMRSVHGNTVPTNAGCEGNSCSASTGSIFYDLVESPSTGTLYSFGSGANVSWGIANTNTGVSGKTCAANLVHLTLTNT